MPRKIISSLLFSLIALLLGGPFSGIALAATNSAGTFNPDSISPAINSGGIVVYGADGKPSAALSEQAAQGAHPLPKMNVAQLTGSYDAVKHVVTTNFAADNQEGVALAGIYFEADFDFIRGSTDDRMATFLSPTPMTFQIAERQYLQYTFPVPETIPSGKYWLRIVAKNQSTMALTNTVLKLDVVNPSGDMLQAQWDTSKVIVGKQTFSNLEGPTVEVGQAVSTSLPVINPTTSFFQAHAHISVYDRDIEPGVAPINEYDGDKVTWKAGGAQTISLPLNKDITKPGSYMASVVFKDPYTNKDVSATTMFRWVVSGKSARVLAVTGKQYSKTLFQRIVQASVIVVGSADGTNLLNSEVKVQLLDSKTNKELASTTKVVKSVGSVPENIPILLPISRVTLFSRPDVKVHTQILLDGKILQDTTSILAVQTDFPNPLQLLIVGIFLLFIFLILRRIARRGRPNSPPPSVLSQGIISTAAIIIVGLAISLSPFISLADTATWTINANGCGLLNPPKVSDCGVPPTYTITGSASCTNGTRQHAAHPPSTCDQDDTGTNSGTGTASLSVSSNYCSNVPVAAANSGCMGGFGRDPICATGQEGSKGGSYAGEVNNPGCGAYNYSINITHSQGGGEADGSYGGYLPNMDFISVHEDLTLDTSNSKCYDCNTFSYDKDGNLVITPAVTQADYYAYCDVVLNPSPSPTPTSSTTGGPTTSSTTSSPSLLVSNAGNPSGPSSLGGGTSSLVSNAGNPSGPSSLGGGTSSLVSNAGNPSGPSTTTTSSASGPSGSLSCTQQCDSGICATADQSGCDMCYAACSSGASSASSASSAAGASSGASSASSASSAAGASSGASSASSASSAAGASSGPSGPSGSCNPDPVIDRGCYCKYYPGDIANCPISGVSGPGGVSLISNPSGTSLVSGPSGPSGASATSGAGTLSGPTGSISCEDNCYIQYFQGAADPAGYNICLAGCTTGTSSASGASSLTGTLSPITNPSSTSAVSGTSATSGPSGTSATSGPSGPSGSGCTIDTDPVTDIGCYCSFHAATDPLNCPAGGVSNTGTPSTAGGVSPISNPSGTSLVSGPSGPSGASATSGAGGVGTASGTGNASTGAGSPGIVTGSPSCTASDLNPTSYGPGNERLTDPSFYGFSSDND
jgi:hypothetical protein